MSLETVACGIITRRVSHHYTMRSIGSTGNDKGLTREHRALSACEILREFKDRLLSPCQCFTRGESDEEKGKVWFRCVDTSMNVYNILSSMSDDRSHILMSQNYRGIDTWNISFITKISFFWIKNYWAYCRNNLLKSLIDKLIPLFRNTYIIFITETIKINHIVSNGKSIREDISHS